jgi:hypothetical protein
MTGNRAKQEWNRRHYLQIKVSVENELGVEFKDYCRKSGVSIAGELSGFMRSCVGAVAPERKKTDNGTRRQRRKEVLQIISRLEDICCREEIYRDRIPENLQGAEAYELAEQCVSTLEEAIGLLREAY